MNMNPDKRPTARQALLDPWLLKYSAQAKNHAKKLYDSIKQSRPAAPLKSQVAPAFSAPDRTTSKAAVHPATEQSSAVQPQPAAAPVPSAANGATNSAPSVPPKSDKEKEDDVDDSSNDSAPVKRKTTVIHQTPSNPFFHPDGFIHDDIANITNTDDCLERLSTQVQASVDPKDEANLVEEVWNLQESEKLVITPKKRFQRAVRLVSVMNYLESESKEHFSDIYDEYLSSDSKTLTEGVEKLGL
jgi:hypothetical protein